MHRRAPGHVEDQDRLEEPAAARRFDHGGVGFEVDTKAETLTFLESAGVPVETSGGGRDLSVADIGEKASAFSALIDCKR